jgi:hypothetical protein
LKTRTRILRLFLGVALVVVVLVVVFALLPGWIHTWGATAEEAARVLPGDGLASAPVVAWTHAATIDAPPTVVWPWIAQMGDVRGGFYSYTFIEDRFQGEKIYHNANEIVPQWQDPQPGQRMIDDMLAISAVEPGRYLLAAKTGADLVWIWLWYLEPQGQDQTRLIVRMYIQTPPELNNPLVTGVFDLGGFIMERRMIEGIVDRAEGRSDPAYSQAAEVILWLLALLAGLAAAVLFLTRKDWKWPLAVGLAALLALLAFTFVQPPNWIRLAVDLALLAGVGWVWRGTRAAPRAGQGAPLPMDR